MCPFVLVIYLVGCVQLSQGLSRMVQHVAPSTGSRSAVSRLQSLASATTARARCGSVFCQAIETATPAAATQQQQQKKGGEEQKQKQKQKKVAHGKPFVVGLSHKTATVEVREKLSIPEAKWNQAAKALTQFESIQEAAILSTCNRFEVYIVAENYFEATRDVMSFLRGHSGLDDAELRPNLFVLQDEDATWHLLRVSSGLDSLVVGEGQILSQVKACYSHAIEPADEEEGEVGGSAGKVLGRLLNSAVMSGKWVRSETEIAKGAVSISSAAVELAVLKTLEDLSRPLKEVSVTIVGAGKMSRLLLTHLASHGVTKVVLLNRSRPRAEELAAEYPDLEVRVGLMDELWDTMQSTDLAFTSTSSTGCILTLADLKERSWGSDADKKLVAIDISVPRNVESECNDLDNVFAYNVDDLKAVVAKNQARRKHKVIEAENLLRVELAKFVSWQESLLFVPAISKLQSKYEQIRSAELEKALKKNLKSLDDKQRMAVDVTTKSILNKLLHGPMSYLRSDDTDGRKASLQQVHDIFNLE